MPRLTPCPACNVHVLSNERTCPHGGETIRSSTAGKSAVVLMGLALAGCPQGEPEYGVPDTDSMTTGTGTTTDTAEPEYGVPDTAGTPDATNLPPTKD